MGCLVLPQRKIESIHTAIGSECDPSLPRGATLKSKKGSASSKRGCMIIIARTWNYIVLDSDSQVYDPKSRASKKNPRCSMLIIARYYTIWNNLYYLRL